MAYKFQLGAAILSGSIQAEDGIVSTDVDDATAANIVTQIDAGEIPIAKLASSTISGVSLGANLNSLSKATNSGLALTSYNGSAAISDLALDANDLTEAAGLMQTADKVVITDGSDSNVTKKLSFANMRDGVLTAVSGDATIAGGGALTIAAGAVEHGMLAEDIISGQAALGSAAVAQADLLMLDDGPGAVKKVTFSNFEDSIFGNISGDATVAAGGALTIAANAVQDSMVNDDVATGLAGTGMTATSGELNVIGGDGITANDDDIAVTADQTTITSVLNASLKVGTAADQEYIDFGTTNQIHLVVNDTPVARAIAGTFIVDGNLHVSGTTTSVDSTTINISSSFTFEGPVDAHETILAVGTPTADITVMLPQYNTAETVHMAVLADATTDASSNVLAAEFALLDGGNTPDNTVALANGDGVLYNDGGTMKQVDLRRFTAKFAGNGIAATDLEMNLDINGLAGTKTAVGQGDLIAIADSDDSNIVKKVTLSNFEDEIFGNISGDATIASGGALTIANDAVESGMLNDNVISGQTELLVADIADEDEFLISDGGTLKKVGMDSLRTSILAGSTPTGFGNADATLVVGVNFSNAAPSQDRTLTLPASPGEGQSVRVKANADMAGGNLIIARDGSTSHTIDGATLITLESPNAAVELVYVGSDLWKVF